MTQRQPPSDSNSSGFNRERLVAIALMCSALVCFSLLDATAKWLNPITGPLGTTFARYASGVMLVMIFINPWSSPGVTVTAKPWMQAARSLLLFLSTITNFLALQWLQLTETMSIIFLTPLIVALLSGPLLGEWVGPRRMVAIGVGFAGVLVVTRPGFGAVHPAALFSVVGAFCYAFYGILTRILSRHDSSATTMFYSHLVGITLLTPLLPFVWRTPESALIWLLLGLLGVFGAFGHWLLVLAYKRAPASTLSPFIYTQIIWMVLLGWIVFNDLPDRWTIIGSCIVIASGLYLLHRERMTGRVKVSDIKPADR